jgi:hypothetical protein
VGRFRGRVLAWNGLRYNSSVCCGVRTAIRLTVARSFVGEDGEPLSTEKSVVKTRAQSRSDPGGGLSLPPVPRITYLIPRGGMQTLAFTTFTDARSYCALASGARPDGLEIYAV